MQRTKPNARLAQARLNACRAWPAASGAIMSLIPVEKRGLGTLCVDQHWRLYFDPDYLATVPDHEAVSIILHEVSHLLLKHFERGRSVADWDLWNQATDLAVNYRLNVEGQPLPPDVLLPPMFQLPGNLSAEQYYRHLEDRKNVERQRATDPQAEAGDEPAEPSPTDDHSADQGEDDNPGPEGQGEGSEAGAGAEGDQPGDSQSDSPADESAGGSDGAGDDGEPGSDAGGTGQGGPGAEAGGEEANRDQLAPVKPGTSGSCSDGQMKPWEDPPPDEDHGDAPPAMAKHDQEQIIRKVAEQIEQKGQGSGKGGWSDFAQQILHPRIDPRVLLTQAIRKAVDQTSGGHDDTSYRRPSRRPSVGGVIRPSRVALVPRILVIVDSSGSMDQQDLGYALGLIGKVLSGFRLRDGVMVMIGDTDVQSCEKVFNPKGLKITGGGGTEMDRLIVAGAKLEPQPQLILVATDGITRWPREPVGVPVVACLTQDTKRDVPAWIKSINLA